MNTNTTIAIIIVVLVAAGGWYLYSQGSPAPTQTQIVAEENEEETGDVFAATVEYSDQGFAPKSVTIEVGETVRFVNTSSHDMWVATASHPTHSKYDGTTTAEHCGAVMANNGAFDQCQAVPAGSMWDYTFTKAGTWPYHNHSRSSDFGTIVVTAPVVSGSAEVNI